MQSFLLLPFSVRQSLSTGLVEENLVAIVGFRTVDREEEPEIFNRCTAGNVPNGLINEQNEYAFSVQPFERFSRDVVDMEIARLHPVDTAISNFDGEDQIARKILQVVFATFLESRSGTDHSHELRVAGGGCRVSDSDTVVVATGRGDKAVYGSVPRGVKIDVKHDGMHVGHDSEPPTGEWTSLFIAMDGRRQTSIGVAPVLECEPDLFDIVRTPLTSRGHSGVADGWPNDSRQSCDYKRRDQPSNSTSRRLLQLSGPPYRSTGSVREPWRRGNAFAPQTAWTPISDTIDWQIMGSHTSRFTYSRPRSPALALPFLLMAISAFGQEGEKTSRAETATPRIPDVIYIPTPDDIVDRMLRLAAVTKDDVVYDLGCGDGRIVIAAAKTYGCRAVGVDIDPLRADAAKENVRKYGLEKLVTIRQQDLFEVDLREATVVTLYLSTRYNTRLVPELAKMKPGSRVVSHLFGIEGIAPDKVVTVRSKHDRHEHHLFLWNMPLTQSKRRTDENAE